jgi:hypothetical protein
MQNNENKTKMEAVQIQSIITKILLVRNKRFPHFPGDGDVPFLDLKRRAYGS